MTVYGRHARRETSPTLPLPRRLTVALACPEGEWSYDWPAEDDPFVGPVVRVRPPYHDLGDGRPRVADVVVLRCEDPAESFRELRDAMGSVRIPVVVISPREDVDTVLGVFRGGGGYFVEGDYSPSVLSVAVMDASYGHLPLSAAACAALREGARRLTFPGEPEAILDAEALGGGEAW